MFPLGESVLGDWLEHRSRRFHVVIGLLMMATVGLLKAELGPQVAFSAISLIPIAYLTWFASRAMGIAAALGSASGLLLLNLLDVHKYSEASVAFWNAAMDLGVFLVIAYSLSTTKTLYLRARALSREDALTGVLNRRGFVEALSVEARRARRYRYPITLAYIDLDDFKRINDRFGHNVGDQLLKATAQALRESVREVDAVGRLGGDEFVVLLTAVDADAAAAVLRKVAASLQTRTSAYGLSLSVGAISFTHPEEDADRMIDAADRAMYTAKREGKHRIVRG